MTDPRDIDSFEEALPQEQVVVDMEMDDGVLIELVAQYPILYDMPLKDYKNNVLKESIWESIGTIMQQPASECMKRWSCLRDSFRREKKKRDLETRSGSGLAKRKGFAMYNHMRFLDCHIKKRRCYTNASQINTSNFALTIPPSHNAFTQESITEGFTARTPSNMELLLPITPVVSSSNLTSSSHPHASALSLDYNTFLFGNESNELLNMTSVTQPATAVASSRNMSTLLSTRAAAPSSSYKYRPTLISSTITSMALVNAMTSTTSNTTLDQNSNKSKFKLPLTIPTPFLTTPAPPPTTPTPPPTTPTPPSATPTPPPTTPTPPSATPTAPPNTLTPPPTTPTVSLTTITTPTPSMSILTTPTPTSTIPSPPPIIPTPPPTTPTLPLTTPTTPALFLSTPTPPLTIQTTPTSSVTAPTPPLTTFTSSLTTLSSPPTTPTPPLSTSYYSQALRAPTPSAPTLGCQSFLPPSPSISTCSSSAPMSPMYSPYSYPDISSSLSDLYADDSVHSVRVDANMKPTKPTVIKKDSSMSRQFAPHTLPRQERGTSSLLNNHVRNLSQSEKLTEPKACFNKDFVRSKKMDPIEASFINLSTTIQNRLQNSNKIEKENCNPDQIFGKFVGTELERMAENRKSKIKCKIMQLLYDDESY